MEKKTKVWVYGGLALVAGIAAYKYFKGSKVKAASTSTTYLDNNGNVTTVNTGNLNFKGMADSLFNAFDGYGTDEATVYSVFSKLKSDDDMNKLIAAYGKRKVSSGTGNIFVSDYNGDLFGAIKDEMSDGAINAINTNLGRQGVTIKIS